MGIRQDESKKSKSIPALPYGVGLKSSPIPTPSPLQGGGNLNGTSQVRWGKIAIPMSDYIKEMENLAMKMLERKSESKRI